MKRYKFLDNMIFPAMKRYNWSNFLAMKRYNQFRNLFFEAMQRYNRFTNLFLEAMQRYNRFTNLFLEAPLIFFCVVAYSYSRRYLYLKNDSPTQRYGESPTPRIVDTESRRLRISLIRRVADSPYR